MLNNIFIQEVYVSIVTKTMWKLNQGCLLPLSICHGYFWGPMVLLLKAASAGCLTFNNKQRWWSEADIENIIWSKIKIQRPHEFGFCVFPIWKWSYKHMCGFMVSRISDWNSLMHRLLPESSWCSHPIRKYALD